jgi:hypothetical protein
LRTRSSSRKTCLSFEAARSQPRRRLTFLSCLVRGATYMSPRVRHRAGSSGRNPKIAGPRRRQPRRVVCRRTQTSYCSQRSDIFVEHDGGGRSRPLKARGHVPRVR